MDDNERDLLSRVAVLESEMECFKRIKAEFIAHTAGHREETLQLAAKFVTKADLDKAVERLEARVTHIPPWTAVIIGLMMAFLGALITVVLAK